MHAAPILAVALAAVVVLSGCSAEPEPTAAPASAGVAPERYRTPAPSASATPSAAWPSPSHLIPGTGLTASSQEGMVVGPTGALLRYVPADPAWSPKCRPATSEERAALEWHVRNNTTSDGVNYAKGAPLVVDLPEPGWWVVAYWDRWGSGETDVNAAVRGGGKVSGVGTAWAGTHTYGGAAFADGPKALRAARECLGGGVKW